METHLKLLEKRARDAFACVEDIKSESRIQRKSPLGVGMAAIEFLCATMPLKRAGNHNGETT